jgi:hypothetical protein
MAVMNDHQSMPGGSLPADRSRRSGILRAALVYLGIVYAVWVCYYTVGDLNAGNLEPGVLMGGLYTTPAALILIGIPTVLGTTIVLLLRPSLRPVWFALLSVVIAFGPPLYWWSRPSSDHRAILVQQIAQALFLGYLLLRLRRPAA